MVAQHHQRRHVQNGQVGGQLPGLGGVAVAGQVAGHQQHVGGAGELLEVGVQRPLLLHAVVDVAHGGDPHDGRPTSTSRSTALHETGRPSPAA